MDAEKARNRKALKAAQMALQGVGDDAVGDAFDRVAQIITAHKGAPAPEAPKTEEKTEEREEKASRNRQERGGRTRSE